MNELDASSLTDLIGSGVNTLVSNSIKLPVACGVHRSTCFEVRLLIARIVRTSIQRMPLDGGLVICNECFTQIQKLGMKSCK